MLIKLCLLCEETDISSFVDSIDDLEILLINSNPVSFSAKRSIAFDNSSNPSPASGWTEAYKTDFDEHVVLTSGKLISNTFDN